MPNEPQAADVARLVRSTLDALDDLPWDGEETSERELELLRELRDRTDVLMACFNPSE